MLVVVVRRPLYVRVRIVILLRPRMLSVVIDHSPYSSSRGPCARGILLAMLFSYACRLLPRIRGFLLAMLLSSTCRVLPRARGNSPRDVIVLHPSRLARNCFRLEFLVGFGDAVFSLSRLGRRSGLFALFSVFLLGRNSHGRVVTILDFLFKFLRSLYSIPSVVCISHKFDFCILVWLPVPQSRTTPRGIVAQHWETSFVGGG